jgi:hypothetical protein
MKGSKAVVIFLAQGLAPSCEALRRFTARTKRFASFMILMNLQLMQLARVLTLRSKVSFLLKPYTHYCFETYVLSERGIFHRNSLHCQPFSIFAMFI